MKDGDRVKKGATIFEIETDKSTMEVEAPGDGTIGQISARKARWCRSAWPVAFIFGEGEDAGAIRLPAVLAGQERRGAEASDAPPPSSSPVLPGIDSSKPARHAHRWRAVSPKRRYWSTSAAIAGEVARAGEVRAEDASASEARYRRETDCSGIRPEYDLVPDRRHAADVAERLPSFQVHRAAFLSLGFLRHGEAGLTLRQEINAVEDLPEAFCRTISS